MKLLHDLEHIKKRETREIVLGLLHLTLPAFVVIHLSMSFLEQLSQEESSLSARQRCARFDQALCIGLKQALGQVAALS